MKSFFRPSRVITGLTITALVCISTYSLTYQNNPPTARTGAPGESNCTSCHSGTAVTSGTNFNSLSLGTTMIDDEYVPDSTYEITVSYVESGKNKFGFSATALKASDNSKAGDFTLLSTSTTGLGTAMVNSNTRQYVHQKSSGTAGSGKIDWTFEWTAPSTNEGDVKVYVALNASNSNGNASGDKIVLRNFTIPPSSRLPKADIKPASLTVCQGDTLFVDGSGSVNETSYLWKTNGGTQTSLTDSTIKIVWGTAGTKNVKLVVRNALGASEEEAIVVTVLPPTTFTVTQTDSIVCSDESIFLEASGAVSSWEWNTKETSNKIEVRQSGTYFVEGTGSNGCKTRSKDFDLTILTKSSVSLSTSGIDTFCSDEPILLTTSAKLNEVTIIDKAVPVAMGMSTDRLSFQLPPGPYSFTAEGKDTFGCEINRSQPLNVFVSPKLMAPIANCVRVKTESIGIEWSDDPQAKGYELSLDSGKTWIQPNTPNGLGHDVSGLTFGTNVNFRVRAKVFTYCNFSEETELNCKTRECFKVNYDVVRQDACSGDSARLIIENIDLNQYGLSFDGNAYGVGTRYAVGSDTGNYKVSVSFIDSNALSCPSVDTVIGLRISMKPNPVSFVNWQQRNGENLICADSGKKELTGNLMQDNKPFDHVEWKGMGVSESNGVFEFDPSTVGSASTTLSYVLVGDGGCEDSLQIEVLLDPAKEVSFTTSEQGRNVSFTQTVTGTTSWKWYFGDGDSTTLENPTHYYNTDGSYQVELRTEDPNNICPEASSTQTLDLIGDGINYASLRAEIYPVPFTEVLSIQMEEVSEQYEVRIYDTKGSVVFEQADATGAETLNLSNLQEGVYLLYIASKSQLMTRTIIKQ